MSDGPILSGDKILGSQSSAGNVNLAAGSPAITGILPVPNGGTGTNNGSITGTGALTFAAGGSNQGITFTPSGSGGNTFNGNVTIGGGTVTLNSPTVLVWLSKGGLSSLSDGVTSFFNSSGGGGTINLTGNNTGGLVITKNLRLPNPTVPASAAATGTVGDIAWDTGFIYVCTASNTWKRVAIATW